MIKKELNKFLFLFFLVLECGRSYGAGLTLFEFVPQPMRSLVEFGLGDPNASLISRNFSASILEGYLKYYIRVQNNTPNQFGDLSSLIGTGKLEILVDSDRVLAPTSLMSVATKAGTDGKSLVLVVNPDFIKNPILEAGVPLNNFNLANSEAMTTAIVGSVLYHEQAHATWNRDGQPKILISNSPVSTYDKWFADESLGFLNGAAYYAAKINSLLSVGQVDTAIKLYQSQDYIGSINNSINMSLGMFRAFTGQDYSSAIENSEATLISKISTMSQQIAAGQNPTALNDGSLKFSFTPDEVSAKGLYNLGLNLVSSPSGAPVGQLSVPHYTLERFCNCRLVEGSIESTKIFISYLNWGAPTIKDLSLGVRLTYSGTVLDPKLGIDPVSVKNRINTELQKQGKTLIGDATSPGNPEAEIPNLTTMASNEAEGDKVLTAIAPNLYQLERREGDVFYDIAGHGLIFQAKMQTGLLSGKIDTGSGLAISAKNWTVLAPSGLSAVDSIGAEADRVGSDAAILNQLAQGQWSADGSALGASTAGSMPTLTLQRANAIRDALINSGKTLVVTFDASGKRFYLIKLPPELGGVTVRVPVEG